MDTSLQSVCPDELLKFTNLRPLSWEDFPLIHKILSPLSNLITHYSTSCIFGYANLLNILWMISHQHLCLFMIADGFLHLYAPPLPDTQATDADLRLCLIECFELMNNYNAEQGNVFAGTINVVSDERLERIQACNLSGLTVDTYPMGKDYIYEMQKIITLSGNNLASKRQERNKFIRIYPNHRTEEMTTDYVSVCIELLHKWSEASIKLQNVAEENYLKDEIKVCEWTLNNWQKLNLKGMVLIVNDEVIGFTFGEALGKSQAYIVIEKVHPDFKLASAFIFSEFCRLYWSHYIECNASDDGNCPNLRFTKELYRPIRLLNKSMILQFDKCI